MRSAISRERARARPSSRLATLAHAIISTTPTSDISRADQRRVRWRALHAGLQFGLYCQPAVLIFLFVGFCQAVPDCSEVGLRHFPGHAGLHAALYGVEVIATDL